MVAKKTAVLKTRPQQNTSRADEKARPRKRTPVSGARDILTILQGKDPNYVYRFVKDVAENGARVLRFLEGGYSLVRYDEEDIVVGENHVFKSTDNGSIIVVKEGAGYNYLMKIRRDWYEEDQQAKENNIKKYEGHMKRRRETETDDGMYGKPEIGQKFIP
jgi:DNA-binding PadR family transcriptional regulator